MADIHVVDASGDLSLPRCPYGPKCYRRNVQHFREYSHPAGHERAAEVQSGVAEDDEAPKRTADDVVAVDDEKETTEPPAKRTRKSFRKSEELPSTSAAATDLPRPNFDGKTESMEMLNPLGTYFTRTKGLDPNYNDRRWTRSMKMLLAPEMGNLQSSVQFNYCFDIPWIVDQYPEEFRSKPLMIVHGDKASSADGQALRQEASLFPNITLVYADLPIAYGTHHTKMMLLSYDVGMRVVIHTSNLLAGDWHNKTQGMWISPLLPKGTSADSITGFQNSLVHYLKCYHNAKLNAVADALNKYDMSSVKVFLIPSVPGRHMGPDKTRYGHLRLRTILQEHAALSAKKVTPEWPLIGQFSSIGSIGPTSANWLTGEFLESLSMPAAPMTRRPPLNLIFPSVENVRMSSEGWNGGGSLPHSEANYQKQPYLYKLFHVWKSDGKGRTSAMPHIKTYARIRPDLSECAWLAMTSANMSKAAWGAYEKNSSQLMIRSYELGVLFLPSMFSSNAASFKIAEDFDTMSEAVESNQLAIMLPYDLPLVEYAPTDRPWTSDNPQTGLKDIFGRYRERR
ncbi:hypothetical protein RvY_13372-2 [Ramazzottius varieornatus]|nr:hypothetical protein RvY_13372-2 [Ramazzottius varieornatus]